MTTRGRTPMHTYEALQPAVPCSIPACSVLLHKRANVTLVGRVTGTWISVITPERRDERGAEAMKR